MSRISRHVPSQRPCDLDWDALPGDGPVRVCPACGKQVHNLSAMPRHEAERLVTDRAAAPASESEA